MNVILKSVGKVVNKVLNPFGLQVVRRGELSEPPNVEGRPVVRDPIVLPVGAEEYLRSDNPHLIELRSRYGRHDAIRHSVWQAGYLSRELTLSHFRGDNAYIWQVRKTGPDPLIAYALTTYYAKETDRLNLFHHLKEDGQFGVVTFQINDDLLVSRDLLDSILEINFLERQLKLSQMVSPIILDIGAGYGRLAYRMVSALSNVKAVYCTDGVAESTFLCEYYLRYRKVDDRAKAVPIDEIEEVLSRNRIDIATNIESFTECTIQSITWWLDLIKKYRVRYLMILPDFRDRLVSKELDGSTIDFRPLIEERGFDLIANEPIYKGASCLTAYGLYPDRAFLLFCNRHASMPQIVR